MPFNTYLSSSIHQDRAYTKFRRSLPIVTTDFRDNSAHEALRGSPAPSPRNCPFRPIANSRTGVLAKKERYCGEDQIGCLGLVHAPYMLRCPLMIFQSSVYSALPTSTFNVPRTILLRILNILHFEKSAKPARRPVSVDGFAFCTCEFPRHNVAREHFDCQRIGHVDFRIQMSVGGALTW